ncbi:MAG TPA: hypothetical protein ENN22_07865 [bacterium]|nr:hypothetical protein [bacterium]
MVMRKNVYTIALLVIIGWSQMVFSQKPKIENLIVQQNMDNLKVEITFNVYNFNQETMTVLVKISDDDGATYTVPAVSFSGDYGLGILSGPNKSIIWDAVTDYPEQYGENYRVKLIASDARITAIKPVLEGTFLMGGSGADNQPKHDVYLDYFEISPHAVTNEEYKLFCDATNRAYPEEGGSYQAPIGYFANYGSYPVVGVSWYDAIAYCNWLSQLKGLEPCYDLQTWSYDATKNGYHLPSEAQWEKAVRGNLVEKIYPWGDTAPTNQCNFTGYNGSLRYLMANFDGQGNGPLPADSLIANGYGLKNIVGNVWEWCNDWYNDEYYSISPLINPLGPETGSERVYRGGAWNTNESNVTCAFRSRKDPNRKRYDIGFRVAR